MIKVWSIVKGSLVVVKELECSTIKNAQGLLCVTKLKDTSWDLNPIGQCVHKEEQGMCELSRAEQWCVSCVLIRFLLSTLTRCHSCHALINVY